MQEFSIIQKFFRPLTKENLAKENINNNIDKNIIVKLDKAHKKPSQNKQFKTKSIKSQQQINLTKQSHEIDFSSLNLQDDIAVIKAKKSSDFIISKDIFVENIHFLKSDGAYKIASKLLLTNISDIASSGGKPICYLLGFTKNPDIDNKFLQEFTKALRIIQKKYNIFLIGGDTSNSKQLFYSVTIFGEVIKDKILLRNNAKDGDLIFVSGAIGDAFLGLNIKLNNNSNNLKKLKNFEKKLLNKHYYPEPRIELGQKLLEYKLSKCATDISDGLIADLSNICNASQLNAKIFLEQIPLSPASINYLKNHKNISVIDLITGGDDYELIFSVKARDIKKILQLEKELNLKLTCIGSFFSSKLSPRKNQQFNVFVFPNEKEQKKPIIITKKGYEHQ